MGMPFREGASLQQSTPDGGTDTALSRDEITVL
jgi:hypothetical protein